MAACLSWDDKCFGAVQVGDVVPMESIQLASLDGELSSLRQHLATDSRPVAIVAGSIT